MDISLGLIFIIMSVLGACLSAAIIPSCAELMEAARQERCVSESTGFISGWLNSLIFFGEFIGPLLGGFYISLADEDFSLGSTYFGLTCALIATFAAFGYTILFFHKRWKRRNETMEHAYVRQNQRNRRMRRQRLRPSVSFSGKLDLFTALDYIATI